MDKSTRACDSTANGVVNLVHKSSCCGVLTPYALDPGAPGGGPGGGPGGFPIPAEGGDPGGLAAGRGGAPDGR